MIGPFRKSLQRRRNHGRLLHRKPLINLYDLFGLSRRRTQPKGQKHSNRRKEPAAPKTQEQQAAPFYGMAGAGCITWGCKRESKRKKNPIKNEESTFAKQCTSKDRTAKKLRKRTGGCPNLRKRRNLCHSKKELLSSLPGRFTGI